MRDLRLGPLWLLAALVAAHPLGAQVRSTIDGVVLDHDAERPLAAAVVTLARIDRGGPGVSSRSTDDQGRFAFESLPGGTYVIDVRLLGFHTFVDTLAVESGTDLVVTVPLSVDPIRVEPVVAVVSRQAWRSVEMQGFDERRSRLYGTFFTREDIEKRNPTYLQDLLGDVPGVVSVPSPLGGAPRIGLMRGPMGPCTFSYYLDGLSVPGLDSLYIPPESVEAIEVYRSLAEIPPQYRSRSTCGVVLLWSRGGGAQATNGPARTRSTLWRGLAGLAVAVVLALILGR